MYMVVSGSMLVMVHFCGSRLTHLCIRQDGVNIIVRHDDTSGYSCSDRKVVRLRRVDNGARSRAREMGNRWRNGSMASATTDL